MPLAAGCRCLCELSVSCSKESASHCKDGIDFSALCSGLPSLARLSLEHCKVKSLEGLSRLGSLRHLELLGMHPYGGLEVVLQDISPLSRLEVLSLRGSGVRDATPLLGLVSLRFLDLADCNYLGEDTHRLSALSGLRHLNVERYYGGPPIPVLPGLCFLVARKHMQSNLATVALATGLLHLDLRNAKLLDLSPLSELVELRFLDLGKADTDGTVEDLLPLAGLASLQLLNLESFSGVKDLEPLAGLTALQLLHLQGCNAVEDLGPLSGLTGLRYLNISNCNNELRSLAPLSTLTALETLNMARLAVASLRPLAACTSLRSLIMCRCESVSSLLPLSSLHALSYIDMASCIAVHDLAPLQACTMLETLLIKDCGISERRVHQQPSMIHQNGRWLMLVPERAPEPQPEIRGLDDRLEQLIHATKTRTSHNCYWRGEDSSYEVSSLKYVVKEWLWPVQGQLL